METSEFDFQEILRVSFNFLYFYGIMYPKFDSSLTLIIYIIKAFWWMGFLFTGIVTAEIIEMCYSFDNLEKLINSLFLTLTNAVSIVKYISIFWNQRRILKLAENINRKEFQPKTENQRQILKSHIRLSKIISVLMYSGCASTCIFWVLYPFFEEGGPFLPIAAYIPFNTDKSSGLFVLVYVYEIVATWVGGYTDLTADCLMASLIMVVSAQLVLLNDTLVNLRNFAEDEYKQVNKKNDYHEVHFNSAEFQSIINQKLIECIIHYECIIEFAEEVTSLFTISIMGQFVVSVFVICASLFEITSMTDANRLRIFSMILFLCCLNTEIFPICYFGNEVIIQSHKLTNSAYNSDWIDCSSEFKTNLIIFMTRTQKSLKLYAGNFFELSLDIFVNIIKSSWSYTTVLSTVNE